jgi:hypothetical protein
MLTVNRRSILRNAFVGFGLGLLVTATLGVLSVQLAARSPAAFVAPK